ncbi:MAG: hypothetical protein QOD63_67 [Actinomycetota bacterium]|nr:hypothetical protein [Actinomycetota bacterium]
MDRLRARGDVLISADDEGYDITWWPKGQRGNPFCGRGARGPVLDELVMHLEQATRPPSRDWDDARYAREWQAEEDRRNTLRFWLGQYDREKLDRERVKREEHRERRMREGALGRLRAKGLVAG